MIRRGDLSPIHINIVHGEPESRFASRSKKTCVRRRPKKEPCLQATSPGGSFFDSRKRAMLPGAPLSSRMWLGHPPGHASYVSDVGRLLSYSSMIIASTGQT